MMSHRMFIGSLVAVGLIVISIGSLVSPVSSTTGCLGELIQQSGTFGIEDTMRCIRFSYDAAFYGTLDYLEATLYCSVAGFKYSVMACAYEYGSNALIDNSIGYEITATGKYRFEFGSDVFLEPGVDYWIGLCFKQSQLLYVFHEHKFVPVGVIAWGG
ncbi:MAG: hypothetical protein H7836_18040, partial [Magnetococcus sp. YQC-3]